VTEPESAAEPTGPPAREAIVLGRIGERADFFFRHGAKARVAYRGFKVASLVAGTAVTTAAALGGPRLLTALFGASVILSEGIQQLWGFHERWVRYISAGTLLRREVGLYRVGAGHYAGDPDSACSQLAERAETIMHEELSKFMTVEREVEARLPGGHAAAGYGAGTGGPPARPTSE
jgi:Protein of unknown function (DUF4231)